MKTSNALCGLLSGLLLLAAGTSAANAQVYDFESGTQGWTIGADSTTSIGNGTAGRNSWVRGTAMDGRAMGSNWWTNTAGQAGAERSHVTSPSLLATGNIMSINFNSWSRNESGYPAYYDVEHVQISINGGAFTDVHGSTTLLHNNADSIVRNITFTTTGITVGTPIRYRFLYDTGDGCCGPSGPGRGWAFDNVLVTGAFANQAPTASLPTAPALHCTELDGATASMTVTVGDADNDPLTVVWKVNGVVVATHNLAAGVTSDTLVNQLFGFAPSTLSVSVTDGKSTPVVVTRVVTVADHELPAPSVASLPIVTGECSATITTVPTAVDDCDSGEIPEYILGTTTDPLTYTVQGTYTVTWKYTDPHDATKFTLQEQTVIVKDVTPPTITCPPDASVAYGSVPAAATDVAGFIAQGGTIIDNCDPNGTVSSSDVSVGTCPVVITRSYIVKDAVGNSSFCAQTITVNNLLAEDGVLWHQPLARNGASEDTDPADRNTLKYRFKLGSTIPVKIHAQGCIGDVTGNANVTGKVVVFGDTDMDGVIDANEPVMDIAYNGVGEGGGIMDKIDGHLKYNIDTKKLVQTFKCYILQVTVTDSSTGESKVETVALQAR